MTAHLTACTTVQLIDEAIRRLDREQVERIIGLSVADPSSSLGGGPTAGPSRARHITAASVTLGPGCMAPLTVQVGTRAPNSVTVGRRVHVVRVLRSPCPRPAP